VVFDHPIAMEDTAPRMARVTQKATITKRWVYDPSSSLSDQVSAGSVNTLAYGIL